MAFKLLGMAQQRWRSIGWPCAFATAPLGREVRR